MHKTFLKCVLVFKKRIINWINATPLYTRTEAFKGIVVCFRKGFYAVNHQECRFVEGVNWATNKVIVDYSLL